MPKNNKKIEYIRTMKKSLLLAVSVVAVSVNAFAQQGSDIYLAKLTLGANAPITDLVQVTNTDTYTNQPYFFNNNQLFYTQMEGEGEQAQTDIFLFDLNLGTQANLTQSSTSEYSATPVPNKAAMSVIRVNAQGKQELWEYSLQGNALSHLVPKVEPVGYQVWLDAQQLLLFVLGEPHTLQLLENNPEAEGEIIDRNIGASLFRYRKSPWYLYSQTSEEGHWLKSYNSANSNVRPVLRMPDNVQYYASSPSGYIFASNGETLFQRQVIIDDKKLQPEGKWIEIKLDNTVCMKGVSRMAISPDESMIALVCDRPSD